MTDRDEAVFGDVMLDQACMARYDKPAFDADGEPTVWGHATSEILTFALSRLAAAGFTVTRSRYEPTQWVWSESEGAAFFRSSGWGDDEPLYRRIEGDTDG